MLQPTLVLSKEYYIHIVATCLRMPNINRMIFFSSVRIWLPASCRTLYSISDGERSDGENSLIHAPVAQINVFFLLSCIRKCEIKYLFCLITLAICDADTQHNRVFFSHIPGLCFTRGNSKLLQYFYRVSSARHL